MPCRRVVALCVGLMSLIACGGKEPEKPAAKPVILSFTASAEEAAPGERVTVSWRTRHAEAIAITANGDEVPLGGAKAASGSVEVEVVETTTFVLEARSGKARVQSDPLTVTVPEPRILSFEASTSTIEPGEAVVLSWRTENALKVVVTDASGAAVELDDADPAEGSATVVPAASTERRRSTRR